MHFMNPKTNIQIQPNEELSITSKKGLLDFFKAGRGALLPSIYANSNEMQNQFDIEGGVLKYLQYANIRFAFFLQIFVQYTRRLGILCE